MSIITLSMLNNKAEVNHQLKSHEQYIVKNSRFYQHSTAAGSNFKIILKLNLKSERHEDMSKREAGKL